MIYDLSATLICLSTCTRMWHMYSYIFACHFILAKLNVGIKYKTYNSSWCRLPPNRQTEYERVYSISLFAECCNDRKIIIIYYVVGGSPLAAWLPVCLYVSLAAGWYHLAPASFLEWCDYNYYTLCVYVCKYICMFLCMYILIYVHMYVFLEMQLFDSSFNSFFDCWLLPLVQRMRGWEGFHGVERVLFRSCFYDLLASAFRLVDLLIRFCNLSI